MLFEHGYNHTIQRDRSVSVLVDSRDRDPVRDPHPSSYRVAIPHRLRHVSSARLVSAELPLVTYAFTANNTFLIVTVGSSRRTVQIEEGRYTVTTIVDPLERALNDAFAPDGVSFRIYIDVGTLVYTIQASAPFSIETTDLSRMMGFGDRSSGDDGVLEGTGASRMVDTIYAILRIRNLNYTASTHRDGGDVFAKIPLKGTSFHMVKVDRALSVNRLNPVHRTLDWLDISLQFRDADGIERPMDGEHSLTLEFFAADDLADGV